LRFIASSKLMSSFGGFSRFVGMVMGLGFFTLSILLGLIFESATVRVGIAEAICECDIAQVVRF